MRTLRTAGLFMAMMLAAPLAAQEPAPTPCPIDLTSAGEGAWQLVQGDGFSFCLPASWRAQGEQRWRGAGGASIGFGPGAVVRETRTVSTTVVAVSGSDLADMQRTGPGGAAGTGASPMDRRESREVIGGLEATLTTERDGARYFTRAEWSRPRMHLTGIARSRRAAELQLTIYRTVRFGARD